MTDYKKLSKTISVQHKEIGISLNPLFEDIQYPHIINLSNDSTVVSLPGGELSPKKIRKFLWENKKDRKFQRKNAVIWTSYDKENDTSYIGIGASTRPEVSSRFKTEVLWEQDRGK